jgi:uncharacterized protein (DUF1800 family)
MARTDLALAAHLMRRAGFGASHAELEELAEKDYAELVEDLLHPERFPEVDENVLRRYNDGEAIDVWASRWIFRMINSQRQLQEKMALFWHQVFATAWYKGEHTLSMFQQIDMLRRLGLSNIRTILIEISKNPAMIFWLDNNENHKDEPNENYGRELLELFSMGVDNYTEDDVKQAARAFTGWNFEQPIPLYPHGHYTPQFVYREDDHDDSVKTFLDETGRLNGEDIVDIIVKQPAAAKFVIRHMYNFFVADEPQVPAWNTVPPRDPEAIETLVEAYFESGGEMRSVLRVLFNSDFFKNARQMRVKSPVELVASTVKLAGTHRFPDSTLTSLAAASALMGQHLLNPPTVEGWHTGKEWIDGGTLNDRVNFAVDHLADLDKPGVQAVVARLGSNGDTVTPAEFVDRVLDLAGPIEAGDETRDGLIEYAESGGDLAFRTEDERAASSARVGRMLQLVVASREYQFA